MNKVAVKRRIAINMIIFAITIAVLSAVSAIIYLFPMLFMNPTKTGEIETGIYAICNKKNSFYLVNSKDGFIAIDAGSDIDVISQSLNALSIAPTDIKYVLLTHSDSDHVAALSLFTNAQIYMNVDEVPLVDGYINRQFFSGNKLPNDVKPSELILLVAGQRLELGGHIIESISVPGHTPGSTMYLMDDHYLFSGDAFRVNTNGTISVHPYTMDKKTARLSIRYVPDILQRSKFVFTSHYGFFTADSLFLN